MHDHYQEGMQFSYKIKEPFLWLRILTVACYMHSLYSIYTLDVTLIVISLSVDLGMFLDTLM